MFSDEDLTKATIKSLAFALGFAFGEKEIRWSLLCIMSEASGMRIF